LTRRGPLSSARDLSAEALASGQRRWASVDSPWLEFVQKAPVARALAAIDELDPEWILSAHLPPAQALTQVLCANAEQAIGRPGYVGPTQPQVQAMLAALASQEVFAPS
jgi:hypothetical protein